MNYIPLNIKTEYDLMNSLIKIDDLILYAKKYNLNALGISDTNLFGTLEFINKCKNNNIKPIISSELVIDDKTIYLFAKNYDGLKKLYNIVSNNNIDGNIDLDLIDDNIILVCSFKDLDYFKGIPNVYVKYEEGLKLDKNVLYLDLIRYFNKEDIKYFKYIKYIEKNLTIEEDINVLEGYLCKNIEEDLAKTTYDFISQIDIVIPESVRHIPKYNEESVSYLRALAKKGLEKRLNNNVPTEYKNRLMYELSVIESMGFVDYFLIVYDFVLYAKKNGILVGPGRGSGAASLVNYSLGIINIDPLKYDLIFERFLNPNRITMPDIDIDFDSLRREDVIDYVSSKYGNDKTARIISFNTMAPKQILRDIGRVLGSNTSLIDNLCKTISDEKDFNELKSNYEFMKLISRSSEGTNLINICSFLCGLKKNTSMHAAGVVISDITLKDIMPLYKVNNTILTGYSMEYIESLGLLKMDFLSIKNLNTISNIINDIKSSGVDIDINNIPLDDKRTLNLFRNAYTSGIFQFESDGMKGFLKSLKVDNFNTLIDAIALYRPGPRDMINEYILRKNNNKKYNLNPLIKDILKGTYGIIIYQEQVLEILRRVGKYSYADADIIRRAMSKKKQGVIEEEETKFITNAIESGLTKEEANSLFKDIIKFSSYGFNKSHSVVYSLLAFQMGYLKVNYSKFFMKNLLNMNKSSIKLKEYIDESKLLGINFKNIDINTSTHDFELTNDGLIMPLTIVKSIGLNVSEEIINERNNGPFKSFYDFMIRCYSRSVNKKVIISLVEVGAFDRFKINKKTVVSLMDEIINYTTLCKDLNTVIENEPEIYSGEEYTKDEIISNEIKNYGFYLSFHPVTKYSALKGIKLSLLDKYYDRVITSILYVENIKTINTKSGQKMSFIKLSDETSTVEGIIFPKEYEKLYNINKNSIYKVIGKVEKRNSDYQLIIYDMVNLK